jgi:hypothetical protein
MVWMFVSLKFICWHLTHKMTVLGGDDLMRVEPHKRDWWPYKKGLREKEPLPLLSCEGKGRKHLLCQCPPDIRSARIFILNFLASRMKWNKFLLFLSHPVYGILWWQAEWTKTITLYYPIFYWFKERTRTGGPIINSPLTLPPLAWQRHSFLKGSMMISHRSGAVLGTLQAWGSPTFRVLISHQIKPF